MTCRVKAILERRRAARNGIFVFGNVSGTSHLDPTNFVNRIFKPACEELGIEDLTFHDLRRTGAIGFATAANSSTAQDQGFEEHRCSGGQIEHE